jgi:hypothetical protein
MPARWVCRRVGYAGTLGMPARWVCQRVGYAGALGIPARLVGRWVCTLGMRVGYTRWVYALGVPRTRWVCGLGVHVGCTSALGVPARTKSFSDVRIV